MPLRQFECRSCGIKKDIILNHDIDLKKMDCECGGILFRKSFGNLNSHTVTEKIGKYWNKNLKVGIKEEMKARSQEHMRNHEMHDIIAVHGIEKLKNHPLIKNGKIRKKGE